MFDVTKPKSRRGLATLLTFCGFLALAGASEDEQHSQRSGAPPPVDPAVQARPADQAALMMNEWSIDKASAELHTAPNNIVREQVHGRLDNAFCIAVHKVTNFVNWTGHIARISRDGYFRIDLGEYIFFHDDGITPSTRLFTVISALKEGQPIKISGYIVHEACSGLGNRDFNVHLTSITPL